ncbi:hypothetical protein [Geitlerinema sp. PCC 7407]|nr:hypothetical protein [Geitlerinema sp. PCC 7407]
MKTPDRQRQTVTAAGGLGRAIAPKMQTFGWQKAQKEHQYHHIE